MMMQFALIVLFTGMLLQVLYKAVVNATDESDASKAPAPADDCSALCELKSADDFDAVLEELDVGEAARTSDGSRSAGR